MTRNILILIQIIFFSAFLCARVSFAQETPSQAPAPDPSLKKQVQALTAKVNTLQSENQQLRAGVPPAPPKRSEEDVREIARLKAALDQLKAESERSIAQLTEKSKRLSAENQALKLETQKEAEKSRTEKESLLADKTVLLRDKENAVAQIQNLQDALMKSQKNFSEWQSAKNALADQAEASKKESAASAQKVQFIQADLDDAARKTRLLRAQLDADRKTFAETSGQIREMQNLIAKLQSENAKVTLLKEENAKLALQREATEKKSAETASNLAALKTANQEFDKARERDLGRIRDLKADSEADLSDMRNLRTSFQSYLDSLIASLNERRDKSRSASKAETLQAALDADLADVQNLKSNFDLYFESLVSHFEERRAKMPAKET
ncbi:MAG: hypothetical protein HYZ52_03760 [Candidatus Omnitrophica bacterium]|nr:hypothetical protein [Candidatus Omnitrophota bacterium]